MNTLLNDWCAFCEAKEIFDKSHFLALFKAHSKQDELSRIFSYFPLSDTLIDRTQKVLNAGSLDFSLYLLPKHKGSKAELLGSASAWLKEQARVSRALGDEELSLIAYNAEIIYTTKEEIYSTAKTDIPNNWMLDLIGDEVRNSRILSTDSIYALFEALYGIAADYYLAWYIAQPLIKLDIDFSFYYEFWRLGGASLLTKDKLLVSHI